MKLYIKGYYPVQGAALPDLLDKSVNIPLMLPHSIGSGKKQYFFVTILNSIWNSGIICSNGASGSTGGTNFE